MNPVCLKIKKKSHYISVSIFGITPEKTEMNFHALQLISCDFSFDAVLLTKLIVV